MGKLSGQTRCPSDEIMSASNRGDLHGLIPLIASAAAGSLQATELWCAGEGLQTRLPWNLTQAGTAGAVPQGRSRCSGRPWKGSGLAEPSWGHCVHRLVLRLPRRQVPKRGPRLLTREAHPPHPTGHLHSLQPGPFTLLLGGSLFVMTADVEQMCLR